jgi:hypothetical protein
LNPSRRLTAGLTSRKIFISGTPAQNSAAIRMTPKIRALPRSGWSRTSAKGTVTMATGFQSRERPAKSWSRSPSERASMKIVPSLATSAGWSRPGPSSIQLPFGPVPIASTRTRSPSEKP